MKKTFLSLMLFSSLMTLTGCFKGCSKDKHHEEQSLDKKEHDKEGEENKQDKQKAEKESDANTFVEVESWQQSAPRGQQNLGMLDDVELMDYPATYDDFGQEEYPEKSFGYGEPRSRFI